MGVRMGRLDVDYDYEFDIDVLKEDGQGYILKMEIGLPDGRKIITYPTKKFLTKRMWRKIINFSEEPSLKLRWVRLVKSGRYDDYDLHNSMIVYLKNLIDYKKD